jgi:hypothetical protein
MDGSDSMRGTAPTGLTAADRIRIVEICCVAGQRHKGLPFAMIVDSGFDCGSRRTLRESPQAGGNDGNWFVAL